jgi:2-hydroxychromene-2-carboxylate isomerase
LIDTVEVHIDIMCPFAYQTSLWLRDLRDRRGLTLDWRFFSLEEVNRVEGKKHPWERPWSYGWSMMRIGVALRRRDPALLDEWYEGAGRALHAEGRRPHDPDVARQLLVELELDPGVLDEALADETTHDEIRTDHQRVLDAGGYGVPTMFLPDGQCLYGPVMIDPPTGAEADRLWDLVAGWAEFPHLFEIQRPKGPEQQRAIKRAFEPYLAARDWVSINRGRVIDFGEVGR